MSATLAMINNTSFISHTPFPLIESTEKLTFFVEAEQDIRFVLWSEGGKRLRDWGGCTTLEVKEVTDSESRDRQTDEEYS